MRCSIALIFLVLFAALPALPALPAAALAQTLPTAVPAAKLLTPASRVLRNIDFEERRLGNDEDLPMNWTKVEGPGFPHYVSGSLTTSRAHSGQYSFRFELDGGSLLYRYNAKQLPVQPGAHYHIECYVQTTVMANAKARMSAYFVDAEGNPLPHTARYSELYAATHPDDSWKLLSIEHTCDDPRAAYLVIELGLLQPEIYAGSPLGKRTLFDEDIHGAAWFDDVTVSQVPSVTLSTDRIANIFRHDDPMAINVVVSDRFTDDLVAQLVVSDAEGRCVYQHSGAATLSDASSLGLGLKRMTLPLPELRPGWYHAVLEMISHGQPLGSQALSLIRLADNAPPTLPDARFGIIATELPFEGWRKLPDVLPLIGASRIKLAVWSGSGDVERYDSAAFDQILEKLDEMGIQVTACLVDLPPSLCDKLKERLVRQAELGQAIAFDPSDWTQLLKAPPEDWQPELAYLIARHANHLDRWQLGADGSDDFASRKGMRQVYDRVYNQFAALVPKPDLAMPWPAWYELSGKLPATVALSVPTSVLPSQLPIYMQDLKNQQGHNLSLSLQALDAAKYGRETQIRDLAQRIIYALAADAKRIDIPLSFTVERVGNDYVDQPQELFMIVRTLMTTLSGAAYRGKVPIADGVDAFLFDRNGEGVLAMWGTGKTGSGVKTLAINLGEQPQRIDLWGNTTPLLHPKNPPDTVKVELGVDQMPILLTGIDGPMLQLRASAGFDQPLLESSFTAHARRFHFVNTYKMAISGTLKLKGPPGWTLTPSTYNFSLNPGETFDQSLTIEFPYNSFAGPKTVQAEFTVQSDRVTNFTMPLTLNLGLSDVGMQTVALRSGNDVIVQQIIENYGEQPIDYTAFAIIPGQSRQERLVTHLAPGKSTIKRYRFVNIQATPGMKVRSGLKETEGMRILNDEVDVQ